MTRAIEATEGRLSEDLQKAENRLVEHIDKVDTRLRTVEDETATLSDVEQRLTKKVDDAEGSSWDAPGRREGGGEGAAPGRGSVRERAGR